MIVKNERHVICRCLSSILPLISYWVIVDTGSSDGTQGIIQDFMKEKGVPGEIHERKWVDFAHNRNEALRLAKGKADYVLFMDADQVLEFDPNFTLPSLDKDYYSFKEESVDISYKAGLVNNHLKWKWQWVIHEALKVPKNRTRAILKGVVIKSPHDGFRSFDPQRLQKDAQTLENTLRQDPKNTRYQFYLARTYFEDKKYELALMHFEKRIEMGGFEEEVYWSMVYSGIILEKMQSPREIVIQSYFRAYKEDPSRAEALYYIALYFERAKDYEGGYLFSSEALKLSVPENSIFVKQWIYDYGLRLVLLSCAYKMGKYEEAEKVCRELIASPELPQDKREMLLQNQALI